MENANAGLTPAEALTAAPDSGADTTTTTTAPHDGAAGGAGIDAWSDEQLMSFLDGAADEPAEVQAPAPQVAAPEPEPEAQAPEEEEPVAEPTQDDDEEEPAELKRRQRLTFANEIDALAGQLYRQAQAKGEPISLSEAERRAKAAHGIAEEQPASQSPEAQAPEQQPTADALSAQIEQLDKDLEAAIDDYDTDKAKELRAEIRKLEAERLEAREREAAAATEQQTKFAEAWRSAEDKIIAAYPDMGVETSVMAQRSVEVMTHWRALGDPRADDPNAPVLIGNIVAAELGLAPGQRLGGPKPAQTKTPPAPTRKAPQPASGATGTTHPATSMSMLVESVPDDQFEDFLHALSRG